MVIAPVIAAFTASAPRPASAVPFFIDRRIRGAVTVTVPRHRMDPDRSDQTARVVRQAASRLTSLFSTEPVAHAR
ncbi:hypothetical protein [Spinactinospora alkalitolerans]|uniref:hypothetical protein n=1 Tax=Spinactinospora alkalitolerans TaxID=687207 RepID=UPI001FE80A6C|nr:hypothetical protein [Spinactinospora alkalitolerans]